jgi:hypothetical protein
MTRLLRPWSRQSASTTYLCTTMVEFDEELLLDPRMG